MVAQGNSSVFVGFAEQPTVLADTIRSASSAIGKIGGVNVRTWEDLRIGGTLLVEQIEDAIRAADLAIFDLTQLNENVLYEVGFAIGSNRIIWPLRDFSDESRASDWQAIDLFETVGQVKFTESDQIVSGFHSERPDLQGKPLFEDSLQPQLRPGRPPSIFYFAEPDQTDAGRKVLAFLRERPEKEVQLITADPQEASVQTLGWFAQQLYTAEMVTIHLAARRRRGAAAHNARASLVAGLARGMDKPLLMLAEADYESAIDYKELLYRYGNAGEARTRVEYWAERNFRPVEQRIAESRDRAAELELSTELKSINLGEYVAENEAGELADYFVETATFREVLSGASRVYAGSKGTGKSANALQAEAELRADTRNLVCTIKPPGYDLDGLVRLLTRFEQRDEKGYVAESLWKYLLATELALAVERDLARRPARVVPEDPEWELMKFIADNESWLKADFAARLERAVAGLLEVPTKEGIAERNRQVSEALHAGPLRELRKVLGPALAARRRVHIIVDNLDKAWDGKAEIEQLSRLLLALLSCMGDFRLDLERSASSRNISIALSLFIRSDILSAVSALAREPDKLPVRRIRWPDEASLLDVVERRYSASRQETPLPGELWSKYFCENVDRVPIADWLLRTCLPRPRDILYLLKAAIDHAVGLRHPKVEAKDLKAAGREYSVFAFEAALVEGHERIPAIEDVLLAFAGASTDLSTEEVGENLVGAGIASNKVGRVIEVLQQLSFLGVIVGDGKVVFPDSARDMRKAEILAKRAGAGTTEPTRYGTHPAFWSYLEMDADHRALSLDV
jgi:hypothetical protein